MRIREWLDSVGKTPAWLAERMQVTEKSVLCWIRGAHVPSADHLVALHELSGGKVTPLDVLTKPEPTLQRGHRRARAGV